MTATGLETRRRRERKRTRGVRGQSPGSRVASKRIRKTHLLTVNRLKGGEWTVARESAGVRRVGGSDDRRKTSGVVWQSQRNEVGQPSRRREKKTDQDAERETYCEGRWAGRKRGGVGDARRASVMSSQAEGRRRRRREVALQKISSSESSPSEQTLSSARQSTGPPPCGFVGVTSETAMLRPRRQEAFRRPAKRERWKGRREGTD